jgi:hypothetical protein
MTGQDQHPQSGELSVGWHVNKRIARRSTRAMGKKEAQKQQFSFWKSGRGMAGENCG